MDIEEDDLWPEEFATAFANGTPADVAPSRPRMHFHASSDGIAIHQGTTTVVVRDAVFPSGAVAVPSENLVKVSR